MFSQVIPYSTSITTDYLPREMLDTITCFLSFRLIMAVRCGKKIRVDSEFAFLTALIAPLFF
jgi:hypothetical protein